MTQNDPQDHIPVGETYAWQPQPAAQPPPPFAGQPQPPAPPPDDPNQAWAPHALPDPQNQWAPQDQWNQQQAPGAPYGQQMPAPGSVADQWYPPGPGTTYAPNAGGLPPGAQPAPQVYIAETPKKGKGKLVAALASVTVLVAAGSFAFVHFNGDQNSGGAASPEAAVRGFVDALNKSDVIGALDMMLPGESQTLAQPLKDITSQLQRLEVLDKTATLSKIGGIDIKIDLTSVKSTIVNAAAGGDNDIADVAIAGTASLSVDGSKVPIGKLLTDNGVTVSSFDQPSTKFDSKDAKGATIATVRKGDRWFVSLFYSIAESARKQAKQAVPTQAAAIRPLGGDSPEKAMDTFLAAASSVDLKGLIAAMNPQEGEALQRYAPLFLQDTNLSVGRFQKQFKIAVSEASYTVNKVDGNHVRVFPKTLKVVVTPRSTDAQPLIIDINDGCVVVTSGTQKQDSCKLSDASIKDSIGNKLPFDVDPAKVTTLIDDVRKTIADLKLKGITETNVGGKWFISPQATSFDLTLDVLKALDKTEIQTIIDDVKALANG
jgi:hypothetical protein